MADEVVRVEIGFAGGQILRIQVPQSAADGLRRKLEAGGEGTIELPLEDGNCLVSVSHVLYVTRFDRESRVGFRREHFPDASTTSTGDRGTTTDRPPR
jgi:hypothetical protein